MVLFTADILQEARQYVLMDRGSDYGHPHDDFTRTGRIWAAILGVDEVTPQQVAMCMIGLKISRECNKAKHDNRVDMAGYTLTLDLVEERARQLLLPFNEEVPAEPQPESE